MLTSKRLVVNCLIVIITEEVKMLNDEQKQFRDKLVRHAEMCIKRKQNCLTEEACKQALILPFIQILGYDIFDVDEVRPEHSADFSDKYKNRVDYAILRDNNAVIAIECKSTLDKADRGQLKSYFNACKSVKLGILTDGLSYEFFADCDSPNMMDDEPFLSFNFEEFSRGLLDDEQIKAILSFSKNEFDPDNVGAEAKKKVIFSSIINFLENNLQSPSENFIHYILSNTEGINQKITRRIIEENAELVKSAFQGFIDKRILDRVGLADKRLVKIEEKKEETTEPTVVANAVPSEIITTDEEEYAFKYAKQRLAFLVDSDDLYEGINNIESKDFKTTFTVYYKKERSGKIFNFTENFDGTKSFYFPMLENIEVRCKDRNYKDIDSPLLECYKKAFSEVK